MESTYMYHEHFVTGLAMSCGMELEYHKRKQAAFCYCFGLAEAMPT